jgi:hypothetical protein
MRVQDQKMQIKAKPRGQHFEGKINWFGLKKEKLKMKAHELENRDAS